MPASEFLQKLCAETDLVPADALALSLAVEERAGKPVSDSPTGDMRAAITELVKLLPSLGCPFRERLIDLIAALEIGQSEAEKAAERQRGALRSAVVTEREVCAQIADGRRANWPVAAEQIAKAIRARNTDIGKEASGGNRGR